MRISAAFPSKYLKASDLQDRNVSVIMSIVELEDVGDSERKPVLFFQGKTQGLVLNKTNSRTIAAAYGDDTDAWEGKPLVLFPAMVDFRGDTVEAIRVRAPKPAAGPPPSKRQHDGFNEANPPHRAIPDAGEADDEIPF